VAISSGAWKGGRFGAAVHGLLEKSGFDLRTHPVTSGLGAGRERTIPPGVSERRHMRVSNFVSEIAQRYDGHP
jgi:hypothetical protein